MGKEGSSLETIENSKKIGSSTESSKSEENSRQGFGNTIEFVLSCLGLAVGLGNIWRFPTRAYENGGSAFLIPYISWAILFGLPAVYLEFVAGQYQAKSPPIVFRRIMPILEGVGWMGAIVSANICIYYIVICSWIGLYIFNIFRGHSNIWNKCDNVWNNQETCIDMLSQKLCKNNTPPGWDMSLPIPEQMVYIEGKCQDAAKFANVTLISATEQYFYNNILTPSKGFMDINLINWSIFITVTICWILVGLLILKGMNFMGKVSYVTVLLPYFLVLALFIRGVTLDGASEGLYYYLGKPDYSKIFTMSTWMAALKQLCFSLSIGHGGLMSMASYNDRRSNCFKNAATIIAADTLMSLFGGAAVFSTLGFLAKQRNVTVPEVVESGLSLAFVVYPEAITQMPMPILWASLFFSMLFLLGISTEMALVEVFCTCLYDQYPKLRNNRFMTVGLWCLLLYCIGFIMTTDAGLYWFEMYDEYAAGFGSVCAVTVETIVIVYVYGGENFMDDMYDMMGAPRNTFTKMFGPHSPYFVWNWRTITPATGILIFLLSIYREYPYLGDEKKYPVMFDCIGWFFAFIPIFVLPLIATINVFSFRNRGYGLQSLFMLQKQHVSYPRIAEDFDEDTRSIQSEIPDHEPWESASSASGSNRGSGAGEALLSSGSSMDELTDLHKSEAMLDVRVEINDLE